MARLTVSGHRSSQVLEDFVLVSLTILIGANEAGRITSQPISNSG